MKGGDGDTRWRCVLVYEQHPPDGAMSAPCTSTVFFPSVFIAWGCEAIVFLISAAMVRKAFSTLVAAFADVSRKGISSLSANSFAVSYSTAFLDTRSHCDHKEEEKT